MTRDRFFFTIRHREPLMTTAVRNSREVPPPSSFSFFFFFFFYFFFFPPSPPLFPPLPLLSLLKTVAQPTFIRDHGTPELELHVRKKRFYAATRNESVVNTESLSLSLSLCIRNFSEDCQDIGRRTTMANKKKRQGQRRSCW